MKLSAWPYCIPLAIFAGLVAGLIIALLHGNVGGNKFALHMNEPVPITDIPLLKGNTHFATKDWEGRAYLINFFASWCQPCHAEHDALLVLAQDEHIPIIGIAFQDKAQSLTAFLTKARNPFVAIADDHAGRTGIDWGITGVPETFLIDRTGIIRLHIAGPLTDDIVEHQLLPAWKDVTK